MAGFNEYVNSIQKIIGGVAGTAQTLMGFHDLNLAKIRRKQAQDFWSKNKYKIPESAQASLSSAERQASGLRLPGEDLRRAEMQNATAQGLGATYNVAQSGGDVLATLGNIYGQQQANERAMAMEGAQRYDVNQAVLRDELGRMAGYEEERWRFNSLLPYQQMLAQASQYANRGASYISSGVGAMSGVAQNYINEQGAQGRYNESLSSMMGGAQPQQNTQAQWANYNSVPRNQFGRTAGQESAMQNIASSAFSK